MTVEFIPGPPPGKARGGKGGRPSTVFVGVSDTLKTSPGRWALLGFYETDKGRLASLHAHLIRAGKRRQFEPAGAFEAVTRHVPGESVVRLYARYKGETE